MSKIILYYKYVRIDNPQKLAGQQELICKKLGLKGRILIAEEGINGTVEGADVAIQEYIADLKSHPEFTDMNVKISDGVGKTFPKLSIKVRKEIVSSHLGAKDLNPIEVTGKYLSAEDLHSWIHDKSKEFYIVDMRNDYEQKGGHFAGSIFSGMQNFRDLQKVLPRLKHLQNKTIVTVCTGGVRCEKASGFLLKNGFNDVYQLKDGIVTYMEKFPNEDFLGKLYVFDGRVLMGFNLNDPRHVVVGKCDKCGETSENYINCADPLCHNHFICCKKCVTKNGEGFCTLKCRIKHGIRKFTKELKGN
ncbi:MAG: hypothetical protein JWO40_568 [Candidatus Doudnabacteria bacterium]|nr:hypothetical protein [Candidatus Doudnabacteria bacterium]